MKASQAISVLGWGSPRPLGTPLPPPFGFGAENPWFPQRDNHTGCKSSCGCSSTTCHRGVIPATDTARGCPIARCVIGIPLSLWPLSCSGCYPSQPWLWAHYCQHFSLFRYNLCLLEAAWGRPCPARVSDINLQCL